MTDQPQRHRRWVLASRPHGEPTAENFRTGRERSADAEARVKCCCVPFIYLSTRICAGA